MTRTWPICPSDPTDLPFSSNSTGPALPMRTTAWLVKSTLSSLPAVNNFEKTTLPAAQAVIQFRSLA